MHEKETLDQRQWVVLFIAGVTLCAIFFTFGLYVGKWSTGQAVTTVSTEPPSSVRPAESGPVQSASVPDRSPTSGPSPTANSASPPSKGSDSSSPPPATSAPAVDLAGKPPESSGGTNAVQTTTVDTSAQEQPVGTPTHFYVRAGLFEKSQEAEEFAAMLRSRGFVSAYSEATKSETGQPRYQVLLGPWVDRDSAARTMSELRNEGVSNVSIISPK